MMSCRAVRYEKCISCDEIKQKNLCYFFNKKYCINRRFIVEYIV